MSVAANVQNIFDKANFIRELGVAITGVGEGWCETELKVADQHRQQHGYVHAGVLATMADHTAGGACRSVSGERDVITVEFKINFFRPATGERDAALRFCEQGRALWWPKPKCSRWKKPARSW